MFHVVDDNLIGGKNTAKIIGLFGERAMVFSSAIKYLEHVNSPDYQKPTAIFTDVLMFNMNGYELIEEILAIHPDQKFVVISGRPDMKHPFKHRACFYLSKPYYARDVEKIILEIRKCEQVGPSPETGCAHLCDCREFALNNWICPHSEIA
ncbi:response regulator [Pseudomonadota bacterium]